MKTTEEQRQEIRGAIAEAPGTLTLCGTPIMLEELLDDVDELLNANARLAPKAKAHDEQLKRSSARTVTQLAVMIQTFEKVELRLLPGPTRECGYRGPTVCFECEPKGFGLAPVIELVIDQALADLMDPYRFREEIATQVMLAIEGVMQAMAEREIGPQGVVTP